MKVMIIEDEQMARTAMVRNLQNLFPDLEIAFTASSVKESVGWLKENRPDLIFMDVELSDGNSFEIFRQVNVDASVVMTTAYDNYAIKAFEQGSVDYLLKPIDPAALKRAVTRVRERLTQPGHDWEALFKEIRQAASSAANPAGKERIIVRCNDKIIPVKVSDIAYFYSEDKNNFLMTTSRSRYIVDATLDEIAADLDRDIFFKISRSCIISAGAISNITKQMGGRLLIESNPPAPFEMTVSRSRCEDFLQWLQK
ncbi:MAG: LytR/AlgR family response regulator transcription factor [Candidatus Cryptobacteroides sp.]